MPHPSAVEKEAATAKLKTTPRPAPPPSQHVLKALCSTTSIVAGKVRMRYIAGWVLVGFLASCGESQVVVRETESKCGDGVVQVGEQCDDGNDNTNDNCTNICTVSACGDGILRTDLELGELGQETCDDGNTDDTDGCTSLCQPARWRWDRARRRRWGEVDEAATTATPTTTTPASTTARRRAAATASPAWTSTLTNAVEA